MEDSPMVVFIFQNLDCVFHRIPCMNQQRQSPFIRQGNVHSKQLLLCLARREITIVIKTRFTHCNESPAHSGGRFANGDITTPNTHANPYIDAQAYPNTNAETPDRYTDLGASLSN